MEPRDRIRMMSRENMNTFDKFDKLSLQEQMELVGDSCDKNKIDEAWSKKYKGGEL